jgi:UPF0176 protein
VSQCHQCGKPCDVHTNCLNEGCHLLFINVSNVLSRWKLLFKDCIDVIHLPEEERKATRKGIKNGNKIFKKKIRRIDF